MKKMITLTTKREVSVEEAKKRLQNLLRDTNDYIAVFKEIVPGRIHFHVFTNEDVDLSSWDGKCDVKKISDEGIEIMKSTHEKL